MSEMSQANGSFNESMSIPRLLVLGSCDLAAWSEMPDTPAGILWILQRSVCLQTIPAPVSSHWYPTLETPKRWSVRTALTPTPVEGRQLGHRVGFQNIKDENLINEMGKPRPSKPNSQVHSQSFTLTATREALPFSL